MTPSPSQEAVEALPCPFCGAVPSVVEFEQKPGDDYSRAVRVECRNGDCGPQPFLDDVTRPIAIYEWNLRAPIIKAQSRAAQPLDLAEALKKARETIHALHGDVAWEIYEKHSPEMKQIDAALAAHNAGLK